MSVCSASGMRILWLDSWGGLSWWARIYSCWTKLDYSWQYWAWWAWRMHVCPLQRTWDRVSACHWDSPRVHRRFRVRWGTFLANSIGRESNRSSRKHSTRSSWTSSIDCCLNSPSQCSDWLVVMTKSLLPLKSKEEGSSLVFQCWLVCLQLVRLLAPLTEYAWRIERNLKGWFRRFYARDLRVRKRYSWNKWFSQRVLRFCCPLRA